MIYKLICKMETSIKLTTETEHRLDFLASEVGKSKDFFIQELIERGLDELEDYYFTEHTPVRPRKTKEKTHNMAGYD